MHLRIFILSLIVAAAFFVSSPRSYGQAAQPNKKYQSLLWEITGNGLKQPSYVFGTMHVSNKMVYNLSDSFYYALNKVHTVALELDPKVWQKEMVKVDKFRKDYSDFHNDLVNQFLSTQSFQLADYEKELKAALRTEPAIVNSLLYRNYQAAENFEEDTFLDLFIYQFARRKGKATTGVENYLETEKIVLEALTDMVDEKKKSYDLGSDTYEDVGRKTEDAYRKGDLDLLDSLQTLMMGSEAYRNKFLLHRNEIQAHSIDTLIRKHSAFVGVGAAHLPGKKGVIEILREKGYTLRPVSLNGRKGSQKEMEEQQSIPVTFVKNKASDGFYTVDVPGELYALNNEETPFFREQYSDMDNGAYYSVTRVQTYHRAAGLTDQDMLQKLDSMLYENIPGKIIQQKFIENNGFQGIDVTNRTRQGNLQRYQMWVTPFEVVIFKMSGREEYASGKEGDQFFNSVQLRPVLATTGLYEPKQGGFKVQFPTLPHEYTNLFTSDEIARNEYSSVDKDGRFYMVMKKTVLNYNFLEEDNFDLELILESFKTSPFISRVVTQKFSNLKGLPALQAEVKLNDSSTAQLRMYLQGPHYYLLFAGGPKSKTNFSEFFNSFQILPFRYEKPIAVTDSFLHFKAVTTGIPQLDEEFRNKVEIYKTKSFNYNNNQGEPYWPKVLTANFVNPDTKESVFLSVQRFPQYFQLRDSLKFLDEEIKTFVTQEEMVLAKVDSFYIDDSILAYRMLIKDTNSTRTIDRIVLYDQGKLYRLAAMGGGTPVSSDFKEQLFANFRPYSTGGNLDIYTSKTDLFFKDVMSTDSATAAKAFNAFASVYFKEKDISGLQSLIGGLKYGQKNYFDLKIQAIRELGLVKEKGQPQIPQILKKVYEQTMDTSTFKNAVIKSLISHKTKESFEVLKGIMLADPIVFEYKYDYDNIFYNLRDSLPLARQLYPDILKLLTIEDYKDFLLQTLATLKDSNLIQAADYAQYYTNIYFDAKIALEKHQIRDENLMKKESKEDDDEDSSNYQDDLMSDFNRKIYTYSKLLIPFYDKELFVRKFFDKLSASKNDHMRLLSSVVLLKAGKPVADSILLSIGSKDLHRADLYRLLEKNGLEKHFPAKYKTQELMARSLLMIAGGYEKMDSVELIKTIRTNYLNDTGYVSFYRYRVKKDDLWKMAFAGLQPLDKKQVSVKDELSVLTDKAIDGSEPMIPQLEKEFRKLQIKSRRSGKYFYMDESFSVY